METSKKDSSARQLIAAIQLFRSGELDSAITLAAAAEGILPETNKPYIFKALQEHKELEANQFINWLKHPGGPQTATIDEFETVIVIARAITKFNAVYDETIPPFTKFMKWAHEAGHLPKLA